MKKKERTIEELAKQDLKKLAKKYVSADNDLKDFVKKAESFDVVLKKTLEEQNFQEILKDCLCFAVVGGTRKSTGVHEIVFKFGDRDAIKNDFIDNIFQTKLKEKISDLTKDIEKSMKEDVKLEDNTKTIGRA